MRRERRTHRRIHSLRQQKRKRFGCCPDYRRRHEPDYGSENVTADAEIQHRCGTVKTFTGFVSTIKIKVPNGTFFIRHF